MVQVEAHIQHIVMRKANIWQAKKLCMYDPFPASFSLKCLEEMVKLAILFTHCLWQALCELEIAGFVCYGSAYASNICDICSISNVNLVIMSPSCTWSWAGLRMSLVKSDQH
jgi:hypothetical protein